MYIAFFLFCACNYLPNYYKENNDVSLLCCKLNLLLSSVRELLGLYSFNIMNYFFFEGSFPLLLHLTT